MRAGLEKLTHANRHHSGALHKISPYAKARKTRQSLSVRRCIFLLLSGEALLRWRWVLAVMTPCLWLAVYCTLQSPTYQAQVLIDRKDFCPQGNFTNWFNSPTDCDSGRCVYGRPRAAK